MEEYINAAENSTQEGTEKSFTQEDVNRIVSERLSKERVKREQELAQRELRMTARELLSEKGLPMQLIDALNCADEGAIKKSITVIESVFLEQQSNAKSNIKFRGARPSQVDRQIGAGMTEDNELRKAMGLRT